MKPKRSQSLALGGGQRQQQRQSIISRQSIGAFLETFPPNETDYANRELFSAVREIIQADLGLHKSMSSAEKLRVILQSHKFHLFFIALVVIDCICVIVQMIVDIVHKSVRDTEHLLDRVEDAVEAVSIGILLCFLALIVLQAVLLGKAYLKSKLEMFDAFIVVVAFILEIVSCAKRDSVKEIEAAVITFRLDAHPYTHTLTNY